MTARATMRTGELNRLLKAAKAHGFVVEITGERVRLLPIEAGLAPSDASAAQKALAAWRRSA